MVRLLVSVRDGGEAREALAAGAGIVDVKEPSRGALGSPAATTCREVLAAVSGRCPASVALGELLEEDVAGRIPLAGGFRFAKIGLSGCAELADWPHRWTSVLQALPAAVHPVAVAYADAEEARAPNPAEVLQVGAAGGCRALLIDTFSKAGRQLFDYMSRGELAALIDRAHAIGLLAVIGGSLDLSSVEAALRLAPDYLAVRGAVCRGGRQGPLDGQRVRQWVARLAELQLAGRSQTP